MKKYIFVFGILVFLTIATICLAVKKPEKGQKASVRKASSSAVDDTMPQPLDESEIPSVITSPSYAGEVIFPHQLHFEEFELECETCHHETNAAELDFPHEDYFDDFWIDCNICHRETGATTSVARACSNCHHDPPVNIADETLSAKVVIHKNCWECHAADKGVEASTNCRFCHTGARIKF